jgi:hypothetical protein
MVDSRVYFLAVSPVPQLAALAPGWIPARQRGQLRQRPQRLQLPQLRRNLSLPWRTNSARSSGRGRQAAAQMPVGTQMMQGCSSRVGGSAATARRKWQRRATRTLSPAICSATPVEGIDGALGGTGRRSSLQHTSKQWLRVAPGHASFPRERRRLLPNGQLPLVPDKRG